MTDPVITRPSEQTAGNGPEVVAGYRHETYVFFGIPLPLAILDVLAMPDRHTTFAQLHHTLDRIIYT